MIRLYNKNDIKSIVKLEIETLGQSLGEEMLLNELNNRFAHYYVYEINNEVKGYISLNFDGYQAEILNFCVSLDCQRQGIGTKLLSYAINLLYAKGATSFVLEVRESNINAISLYKKLGFKQISVRKNYYSNLENALVLIKEMIPYLEIEDEYLLSFCKKDRFDNYSYYHADDFKEKYFYNFYKLDSNDEELMKSLYKRDGFIQFELPHKYIGKLKFGESESLVLYHSVINGIKILRNNKYEVKKITKEDRDLLYSFLYEDSLIYGKEYAKKNALKHVMVALDLNKTSWYFIYDKEKPVGFIEAFVYKNTAKLEDFVIKEEYQRKGYGSCLISYVLEELKNKGINDIYLTADLEDTPKLMYERMGFIEVGRSFVVREVFSDGKNQCNENIRSEKN